MTLKNILCPYTLHTPSINVLKNHLKMHPTLRFYTIPIPTLYHPYTHPFTSLYLPYTSLYPPFISLYLPYTSLYPPYTSLFPPYTSLYLPSTPLYPASTSIPIPYLSIRDPFLFLLFPKFLRPSLATICDTTSNNLKY